MAQRHQLPKLLWAAGDSAIEEKETWSVATSYVHENSGSKFRLGAGNKLYALSSSNVGEFDETKRIVSDISLYKKYRYLTVFSYKNLVVGSP